MTLTGELDGPSAHGRASADPCRIHHGAQGDPRAFSAGGPNAGRGSGGGEREVIAAMLSPGPGVCTSEVINFLIAEALADRSDAGGSPDPAK